MEGAAAYVEQHKVYHLFEKLMQDLIVQRPDDPFGHLIDVLKRPDVPRVIVAGPPGAQARGLCERLAAEMNLVHIIASDVYRDLAKVGSVLGKDAKALVDSGADVPSSMLLKLVQEKLASEDCINRGWVLEGFPNSVSQARAMLAAGLLPTCFLRLELTDEEVMRRLTNRRVDPEANQIYHLEDSPPPEAILSRIVQRPDDTEERVVERLASYKDNMDGAFSLFDPFLCSMNAAGSESELLEQALLHIKDGPRTKAPRGCPRVLLLGGPGSGAPALAAALAQRFGSKLISAVDVLQTASLSGSLLGAKAAPFLAAGIPEDVPDDVLLPLVLTLLEGDDVRKTGFVMTGFPSTAAQVALLKKKGIWFRHVVKLHIESDAAKRAVCATRYDPFDGAVYHPDRNWPEDVVVAQRLVAHPHHVLPKVEQALQKWGASEPELLKAFSTGQVVVEDATQPISELVERLTPCFLSI